MAKKVTALTNQLTKANTKIEESIESLKIRSNAWASQKQEDIKSFQEAIAELEKVDSEIEIEKHKRLQKHSEMQTALRSLEKEKAYHEDSLTKAENTVTKTNADLEYAAQQKCPTCEQELLDDKHTHLVDKLKVQLTDSTDYLSFPGQETHAQSFSVVCVRLRTFEGITDLLLLKLMWLNGTSPSKTFTHSKLKLQTIS